jgi:adenine-specific DNA-methyltransferase
MQNILKQLTQCLQQDKRLVIDGKLVKNKIVELALTLDESLIKLLLKNASIKKHFFRELDGVLIFDKVEFQKFVSNKQFLPDSYTAFKNKIGLTANGEYLTEAKEVVLAWPYKDCVLEGGQTKEDQKRKEIFWNTTLAPDEIDRLLSPKVLTNFKRYDKKGEQKVDKISINDNLLIKGNNLLTIQSIKNVFLGRVKLIYIDPPYNTGNDGFDYNDSFNHSSWLTFIKNRLQVAKELLDPKGTIAISIDHNELGYLLILLDEIFGIDNRKNIITIKRGSVTGAKVINPGVVNISEYVVLYSRKSDSWKPNRVYMSKEWDKRYNGFILDYDKGYEKWKFTTVLEAFAESSGVQKSKLKKHYGEEYEIKLEEFIYANAEKVMQLATLDENSVSQAAVDLKRKSEKNPERVIVLDRENAKPYHILNGKLILFAKDRMSHVDGAETFSQPATDIWNDVLPNDLHNEGGVELRKGKKPEKLIARLIELCTNENDLVLDFFSGSGTTGTVALKMKRKFIICEQLEYTETLPLQRLLNTIEGEQSGISKAYDWKGGGSFIYAELKKTNAEFSDKIEAAKNTQELEKIWEQMQQTGFISYRIDPKTITENKSDFSQLSLDEQKQFLIELLDKNQLYVNYSEIDDKDFCVSDEDKKLNRQFYSLK